jgi:hypothetical protein
MMEREYYDSERFVREREDEVMGTARVGSDGVQGVSRWTWRRIMAPEKQKLGERRQSHAALETKRNERKGAPGLFINIHTFGEI